MFLPLSANFSRDEPLITKNPDCLFAQTAITNDPASTWRRQRAFIQILSARTVSPRGCNVRDRSKHMESSWFNVFQTTSKQRVNLAIRKHIQVPA